MTGYKPIHVRVRERALDIHHRNCQDPDCREEPTREERLQARREVMPSKSEREDTP